LKHAEGVDILPSVLLLIAEFIRHLVYRAVYYYPPMLPKEMLSETVKIGEVDPKLWIALEDLHDGWEQSGEVGQEVYGAGNSFGILPRHYFKVADESFMFFVDYPVTAFSSHKGKPVTFTVVGDERLACRLVLVVTDKHKLPHFTVTVKGEKQEIKGKHIKDGNVEYVLKGKQEVRISWK
jgi:hypothetical protein